MKYFIAVAMLFVVFLQIPASAVAFDTTQYSKEDLQQIFDILQEELMPVTGEVLYEGIEYSVIWNGFHHRTDDWFVPIFIFKNSSDDDVGVSINNYYINDCLIGYSNGGILSLLSHGMATAASDSMWSIDKEAVSMYGISNIDSIRISANILKNASYGAEVIETIDIIVYPDVPLDSI